ncbi:MAG TPA: hypothetical protein VES89_12305 [Candidatus Competibacteraceae bacterium]|nr:hypothetical protein [Candidatus Competibacteraceae bacterium]
MSKAEGLLISQAYTLDAIYNRLAQRAMSQEYLDHFETVLKLVLQAQFQCARTLEILSTIKNPPNVSFVKQANIAHNQQVNNVPQADQSSATRPPVIDSHSPLEHTHGNYLDTGTATTASGNDSAMATVGEIHRPQDRQGQG